MPTDVSVKAAAWLLYEAAVETLRYLDSANDRRGRECRRMLREAILAAGGEWPNPGKPDEETWHGRP